MSDADLRELERRFRETGSVEDEAAYLRELRRLLDSDPGDGSLRLRLGQALFDLGRVAEAVPELKSAKEREEVAAAFLLGQCYVKQKIYKLALGELGAARRGAAEGSELWKEITYLIARIYESAGHKEEALVEYAAIAEGDDPVGITSPLGPNDPPRVPPKPPATFSQRLPEDCR